MRVARSILPLSTVCIAGIVGCAREPMRAPVTLAPARPVPTAPSYALAFTPPAALEADGLLNLDRAGRGVFADAGFESEVVSETYVRQDDRMRLDRFGDEGTFERRAISTTVTVRQR